MKYIYRLIVAALFVTVSATSFYSCETVEMELLASPNALSSDQADPDLLLNSIQLSYRGSQRTFSNNSGDLGRISYMGGRQYLDNYGDGTLNGAWNSFYSNNQPNLLALEQISEANPDRDLSYHLGVAKTLQAHTLMQLVDYLGDIPWSEANNSAEFPKPSVDDDASVYDAAIAYLSEAAGHFASGAGIGTGTDFFYDGDAGKWSKLVKTLQMRANLTVGNYAAVASATGVIESTADDFQFDYGTNVLSPDNRHPAYASDYDNSGANIYQSNWLMKTMVGQYGDLSSDTDPRRRYYFYRQTWRTPGNYTLFQDINGRFGPAGTIYLFEDDPNGETLSCSLQEAPAHLQFTPDEDIWCSLPLGYWGRTHGNDEGTPPDGFTRTASGVYPAGGSFDGNADYTPFEAQFNSDGDYIGYVASMDLLYPQAVGLGKGGAGAGIDPIYLASYVDFMKAEAHLALGNTTDAATHYEAGMTKSIAKVQSFGSRDGSADNTFAPDADDVAAWIASKVGEFNSAAATSGLDAVGYPTAKDKMDLLGEQYFIAMYGGAGDAFNFIRRTGYPRTLARSLATPTESGSFPRTILYPSGEVATNPNILQRLDLNTKVFWDTGVTNPAN